MMAWTLSGNNIRGPQGEAGEPGKPDPAQVVGVASGVETPLTLWLGSQSEYDAIPVKDDLTAYVLRSIPAPPTPPETVGWTYLIQPAYSGEPGPVPLPPHEAGDLLIVVFNMWADGIDGIPPAGGSVPVWTIGGRWQFGQAGAWAWARATQSNHTSGSWNTTSAWLAQSAVLRGVNESNPIGGWIGGGSNAGAGSQVNVGAVPMVKPDNSSTVITFHYLFGERDTSWVNPPAGYRKLGDHGWQAPNTFLLSGGAVANEGGTGGEYSLGTSPGGQHMTVQIEVLR